jgi:membrane protein insertase Oxa1/YidC/SpoIIIJ
VYQEHGVKLMTLDGLVGLLVQWPILGAFFSVVRRGLGERVGFLWIGNLARPDRALALIVTALTALAAVTIMPATATKNMIWFSAGVSTLVTFAFLWFASSALALSYAGGSMVSMLQGYLMRREKVA